MHDHLSEIDLKPDCKNCVAYCCVALAFDESDMFAYDKQAAEPCKHLDSQHACSIHDNLKEQGFPGCVRYNCFGAGQRVTNEIFEGRSWRDQPDEAQEMFDTYRSMHRVHEFLALLQEARKLDLDATQISQAETFRQQLSPVEPWTATAFAEFARGSVFDDVRNFFKSLSDKF